MAVTIETGLGSTPGNSNVTLLNLGTSASPGLVTSNGLRFGSGNTISFANNSGVYQGTTPGLAATPYGEAGNYFAAEPGLLQPGVSISYASTQRYFGLEWGSVDAGNRIDFYNGLVLVYSLSGADVVANPGGSQGADGSVYVNINFVSANLGLTGFNRVVMTAATPAFEFGDIAFASSVIPTTAGQTGTPTVVTATDSGTSRVVGFASTPASITGTVFTDANANGARDSTDPGEAGVTVRLLNAGGSVVSTDVTDANGRYDFTNVAAGSYTIAVTAPSGERFSPTAAGANGSQVNSSGNAALTVAAGSSNSVNAGVYAPVSLSGLAFTDANGNGVRDSGEAALSGQTVQLLNAAGTVVASTTTGSTGSYSFTGQAPGTYQLQFTAPAGASFTTQDAGSNDAVDSDVGSTGRSASIALTSGGSATNVSAGSFVPGTVSGAVFTDANGDGIRGTAEAGLAGVTVQLVNAAGTVVATASSAANGGYSFANVAPGNYQLQFNAPAGSSFTLQDAGGNDAVDSDANPGTGRTASFTVASGSSTANLSAGLYVPVSIAGQAFLDSNGDGVQGPGEAGLAGQTVQLLNAAGAVLASTTTGSTGAYGFTGQAPGTYQLQFVAPGGSRFTVQDQGGDDTVDSDANPTTGRSASISLASGGSATNVSAGSYVPGTISGLAFTDSNGDGLRGSAEPLLAGITVRLLNGAGTTLATALTGAGGSYGFTGLAPGQYQVEFTAPPGASFTGQDRGTNDALDSDVSASGRTAPISLASGETLANVSAGSWLPAAVTGVVFTDADGDGVQGLLELGRSGVTVRLLDADGYQLSTTTSGLLGAYSFTGVAPGQYQLAFAAPAGTAFSPQDQGGNDALDSDANPTTGRSAVFSAASGQTIANVSAGVFTPIASGTGNVLFLDGNANGIRDAGEAGVEGATVRLLNSAGTVVASTTTAADGGYAFTGAAPGTYQVQFLAPTGTVFTAQNQGLNLAIDSDANPATGRTANITLSSGGSFSNIGAGIYAPASVSGLLFDDANGDGLRGAGESGIAGQGVQLLNGLGQVVGNATTSATGAYSFANLTPGTYRVQFTAGSGSVFTAQDQGNNDAIDSDASALTGRTAAFTLASGQAAGNVSAGTYAPVGISGLAFTDSNGDGIRNSGEFGVLGRTVQLLNSAGDIVATTLTGVNGAYAFTGQAPGTYQLRFLQGGDTRFTTQDAGTDDAVDSDVDPATGRTAPITLASGQSAANVSAGSYTAVSISGRSFIDLDGNGIQGAGELGLAGQSLQLLNASGQLVTTAVTGPNGAYLFDDLLPGTYQLRLLPQAGIGFTNSQAGSDPAVDSDFDPATGRTAAITLASGESALNISAGLFATSSISGLAFTDSDGNGIRGAGDPGLAGVTVQLINLLGAVVATTTTGANGAYAFNDVWPGLYQLGFVAPDGSRFTARNRGGDETLDSDVYTSTGRTDAILLISGGSIANVSAGLYRPGSVSGIAFADSNGDGLQSPGEAGVAGRTVRLLDADGATLASTTTGSGGAYSFAGVAPGSYQLQFVAPSGTRFTARDQGGNDALDSDVGSDGRSASFTLASGGSVTNLSAGSYVPVGIAGQMFSDSNGDGIRGSGEAAVSGATVQLLDAAGHVVASTTTGSTGGYSFTGQAPGTYQVQFVAASGTVFTAQDQGGSDAADSDANPATGRSPAFTLTSGESLANLSAGTYALVTVSGAVFTDADGDGLRGGGEAGIAGATVRLLDANGTLVATTSSGGNGAYSFAGLAPDQYQLAFTAPEGTAFTAQDQGGNDAIDSDANPTTGRSAVFTATSGQTIANVSAGVFTPAGAGSGNLLFLDGNGNGIRDAGEAGVEGASVRLLNGAGQTVATAITAADGRYGFANIAPGTYQVQFTAPDGTVFSPQDQGGDDASDSDAAGNGRTGNIVVSSGGSINNVAAGVYVPVGLGGTLFLDANGDGLRNGGEAGIAGQTVQLLNAAGQVVASTTTGSNGAYGFTGQAPGTYQLQFAVPDGSVFTARDQGNNDAIDSDAGANGRSGSITLASGQTATNVSAGSYVPVSISGVAFTDANGDGLRNGGEAGVAGRAVQLLDGSGALVASTTTGADGAYRFAGQAPGTYQLQFVAPEGVRFTSQDAGGEEAADSDVNPATGRSAQVTLASGQSIANVSAGSYTPVGLSGTVFTDRNGDGIRGGGEAGAAGQTVQLLDATGAVIATTVTGTNGAYAFADLAPGTYQIGILAPPGSRFSPRDQGDSDANDSDVGADGRSAPITLASGAAAGSVSAGIYTPAGVSGTAFTDSNGDGLRNTGEDGLAGITVQLLDTAGAVVASTTTGAGGAYGFADQAPGRYQLQFLAPDGSRFTARDQGDDDTLDSDVTANGRTAGFTLGSGESAANLSAGLYIPGRIAGLAFTDANGDGIRNGGEAGAAGRNVRLLDESGAVVATTTSGGDGAYAFDGVAPGTYQVQFVAASGTRFSPQDQGGDEAADSDVGADGRSAPVTLVSGGRIADLSAGSYAPVSIAGSLFADANGDGLRGSAEAGIGGAVVRLLDANGLEVASTTTGAGGAYGFADLAPGRYQVAFAAPAGRVFTAQDQGGDDALDSDANPVTGRSALFDVASGGSVSNVSAGVYAPGTIGGSGSIVFTDSNGNGIRDAGEGALAGVTVRLLNAAGNVVATTATTGNGSYSFADVAPGQYRVEFVAPAGSLFTRRDQGDNEARDSDVNPANGLSAPFTVTSAGSGAEIGAGLYAPVSIGGAGSALFADSNGNGLREAGEAGIAGAAVRLLDSAGGIIARATTDASGGYAFTGLRPGSYQLQFITPDGRVFTLRDQGDDDGIDSDADAAGLGPRLTLASGDSLGNLSAGVYAPASISGFAFIDADADGIREVGEAARANVTVRLLDSGGAVVATTRTSASGEYGFDGLAPGGYRLEFVAPEGLFFSPRDQGGNNAIDSDADPATGRTAGFTLGEGGSAGNLAAGFYARGTIGGSGNLVFNDADADGIRDAGEAGLGGLTVRLLNPAGQVVASTTTAANGSYSFGDVTPGRYQLEVLAPEGSVFSPRDQGDNDARDSDMNPANGRSGFFDLVSGGSIGNLAAGLHTPTATRLGGDVWLDANGNGVRDMGEPWLQGVRVRLLDASGQALGRTATTDADGRYLFEDLDPGSYRVGFAPLIGTRFTAQDRGGDEALDSDAADSNGVSSLLVRLGQGSTDMRSGAGLVFDLNRSPDHAPSIDLGPGNNGFPGTDGAEIVHGGDGDDNLNGLGGHDSFTGGNGRDTLNGHAGDDALDGGAGNDNVQGQEGNDLLLGGAGDDIGEGGAGNDVLIGGAGNDNMQGEGDDDRLFGGSGEDLLTGNQGNDLVSGGAGNDRLQGADGNDTVIGGRDGGRMARDAEGVITGIVTGDIIEGNGGADAFLWQAGDGVDLMLDFNPNEGDTLTIYGYEGFEAIQRTADGRMALMLGTNAGFVLNNGLFQGAQPGDALPGIRFVPATDAAPRAFVAGDSIIPILAENWLSRFRGDGPVSVSQPFPALDPAPGGADLRGVTFDRFVPLSASNDTTRLTAGNDWIEAGSGFDTVIAGTGFRGVETTLLPDRSLRLDIGETTDLLRGVEAVHFVDGTLHLSVGSSAAQVSRLYDAALGRGADQIGLNYWIDRIDGGAGLLDLANGFLASAEFAGRYGNPSNQDYVELLYQNVLGRSADAAGAAFWTAALAAGTSRAQALVSFSESAENRAAQAEEAAAGIWDINENAAFVARLFDSVLQRQPDLPGLTYWTERLDSGAETRSSIAAGFAGSEEFDVRFGNLANRPFVAAIYQNALDRPAEAAGLNYWTNLLNNGLARSDFVLAVSESAEHVAQTDPWIMNPDPAQFGIQLI